MRSYDELIRLGSLEERFRYLELHGAVGRETFGGYRVFNQQFYHSAEWQRLRNEVIARDGGCELGLKEFPIYGPVTVHHINPVELRDIAEGSELLLSPQFLICVSPAMHRAIHYGDEKILPQPVVERYRNDTCPWRR